MRKLVALVTAALAFSAGVVLIEVAPAPAAPPVEFNPFTPEAIPPGGRTAATLECSDDQPEDGPALVSLDGPGALDIAATPVTMTANGSDSLFAVRLGGPDGLGGIEATAVGTYTFSATCPSGGGSSDVAVEVLTPTVPIEAGLSLGFDCVAPADGIIVPLGSSVSLCYDFTNPLGDIVGFGGRVTSSYQEVGGPGGGSSFDYPTQFDDPPLPAGGSYATRNSLQAPLDLDPYSLEAFVVLDDGAGGFAVSELVPLSYTVGPPLAVTVTSGLAPDEACPEGGGQVDRTVEAGTSVWFCYSVEVLTELDLDDHDVVSDLQGVVASGLMEALPGMGSTFELGVPTPVVIDASVVNTATWSSIDQDGEYFDEDEPLTGVGSATVTVLGSPAPGPAAPAVPVAGSPTFTG
ncbi:MAG: hypothetical protein ACSLFP_02110 [Acidimicrobiales bacterium]